MIPAILRAQFLSMRGLRRGSSRRGAIFSLLIAAGWYGFWAMVGFSVYGVTADPSMRPLVEQWLSPSLLVVFLYWQLAPLLTASFGASLDLRKLLAYPVPRGKLFTVEVLLRVTTAFEMLLVLAGAFTGLLLNPIHGGWTVLPALAATLLLFVLFNLLLAAGLRSLLERLLSLKRVRELMVLLLVMALASPRLLVSAGVPLHRYQQFLSPAAGWFWPWTAAGRAMLGQDIAVGFLVLAAWAGGAWLFGRRQFARSLRFDAQAAAASSLREGRPRVGGMVERLYRLPGLFLPDPLAAIVEKELRALSRTPRFRTVFIMGFTFGLLVWLPLITGRSGVRQSVMTEHFLVVVSLYAFSMLGQVSYWNAFGFDRTAAQVWFSLPVPVSRALAGKNLAAALFILLEVAAITAVCLALRVPIPAARILEAFLVTPVAALYMLSVGNLSSVNFPRAMDPDRVSQGGGANRFQGLLFLVYPLALLPILLAYAGRYVFESELLFYAIMAFAAALGVAVYWIAMESAVKTAWVRREQIIAELSKTAGPVVTD
ncbi:MAG TPA: hypothetical protein VN442_03130 [Bryobacteraceae bacterium]|nr:hypothetical protein [Bryobacteraceae bacterium]